MEAAGLAIGVPGVIVAFLDLLDRFQTYKDFSLESNHSVAQFEADKHRLQQWAKKTGFYDGEWEVASGAFEQNPALLSAIRQTLASANEIVDLAEKTRGRLGGAKAAEKTGGKAKRSLFAGKAKNDETPRQKSQVTALGWAVLHRNRFVRHVEMFHTSVEQLYELAPPDRPFGREATSATSSFSMLDVAKLVCLHDEISNLVKSMKQKIDGGTQETVMKWLDIGDMDRKYGISDYFEKQSELRLESTCEWIFEHQAYKDWLADEDSHGSNSKTADNDATTHCNKESQTAKVLWINGPAGYGKTVLCTNIVRSLVRERLSRVAHFLCSPHAKSNGDPNQMVRFLVAQLAQASLQVQEIVSEQIEKGNQLRATQREVWDTLRAIVSRRSGCVIVIDGLDEYDRADDVRSDFLKRLKSTVAGTEAKVLILSRDEVDISNELNTPQDECRKCKFLTCKISDINTAADIKHYASAVVDDRLPKKSKELRTDLASRLTERCGGMFLWIKIQKDQLRGGKNQKQLRETVENMPQGLQKAYERNWQAIMARDESERQRALTILKLVSYAIKPLTIAELTVALIVELAGQPEEFPFDELPDEIDEEYAKGEIVYICSSLVELRQGELKDYSVADMTVHVIHQSVNEFLRLEMKKVIPDSTDLERAMHQSIAKTCITCLNYAELWSDSNPDYPKAVYQSFLAYAENMWIPHFLKAAPQDEGPVRLVEKFLDDDNECFHHYTTARFKKWPNPNVKKPERTTPIYWAPFTALGPELGRLYQKYKDHINDIGGHYGTPLTLACCHGYTDTALYLLSLGADPNKADSSGDTPLAYAAWRGAEDLAKELIKHGARVDVRGNKGMTPLHRAASANQVGLITMILEQDRCARSNKAESKRDSARDEGGEEAQEPQSVAYIPADDGCLPLHSAAISGNINAFEILAEACGGKIHIENETTGNGPLQYGAVHGQMNILKYYVEKGEQRHRSGQDCCSALHMAAVHRHRDVAEYLLENGLEVDYLTSINLTPLMLSAFVGDFEMVRLLLKRGADILRVTDYGESALYCATISGSEECCKLLIENGADVMAKTTNGENMVHCAATEGHPELCKLFLDRGIDVSMRTVTGDTALSIAVQQGHSKTTTLLLSKGANVLDLYADHDTVFRQAARKCKFETLGILLEHLIQRHKAGPLVPSCLCDGGCAKTKPGEDGMSMQKFLKLPDSGMGLMHSAAINGNTKIMQLLADGCGLSYFDRSRYQETVLHFAVISGNTECIDFCLSKRFDSNHRDAYGHGIVDYACVSGSTTTLQKILCIPELKTDAAMEEWTPLHWAFRSGNFDAIRLLLEKGYRSSAVRTTWPRGLWTPAAIGLYYHKEAFSKAYDNDETRTLIEQCSTDVDGKRVSGPEGGFEAKSDPETWVKVGSDGHRWCDACHLCIYGKGFKCLSCDDFDVCFMCMLGAMRTHTCNSWTEIEMICEGLERSAVSIIY